MKKFSLILLVTILMIIPILSGCSSSTSTTKESTTEKNEAKDAPQKVYEIKIAHSSPATNDRLEDSLQVFKKEVEEKSNGAIKVTTYPNSVLGGEREQLEGVQMGSIEMSVLSTGPFPGVFPQIMALDLPFLFKNKKVAYEVLDGPAGEKIFDLMVEKTGIRGLAWGENGYRHFITTKKPIYNVEDVAGLKIRTMENPAHMAMVENLGADPTPMAFGEVYTSLQQGVIDGLENPVSLIESMRFYEVSKYLTLNGHLYGPHIMIINDKFYQQLPEDLQKVLTDAGKSWSKVNRELNTAQVNKGIDNLKAQGLTIIELSDEQKEAFRQKTLPVYDQIGKEIGEDLVQFILDAVKEAEAKN